MGVRVSRTGKNAAQAALIMEDSVVGRVDIPKTWSTYGITAGLTCGLAGAPVSDVFGRRSLSAARSTAWSWR